MVLQRSAKLYKPGTQVPKTKHNLWQGKFHSTATFPSDQPTHGIATECGIQMPGAQVAQNKPHWHLITKCGNLVFQIKRDADVRLIACK